MKTHVESYMRLSEPRRDCRICGGHVPACRDRCCSDACWRKLCAMEDAAPELLAALNKCVDYFEGLPESDHESSEAEYLAAKAAIAKAKGGAQ